MYQSKRIKGNTQIEIDPSKLSFDSIKCCHCSSHIIKILDASVQSL